MSVMVTELYDALRKAGVEEPLARDAARAVLAAEARTDLATKADLAVVKGDIAELRQATKADLAVVKGDIAELRQATKADLAELKAAVRADFIDLRAGLAEFKADTKADRAELKVELIKWNIGAIAVMTAIFAAISRLG